MGDYLQIPSSLRPAVPNHRNVNSQRYEDMKINSRLALPLQTPARRRSKHQSNRLHKMENGRHED